MPEMDLKKGSSHLQISSLFDIAGRTIAITGAGSGIGRMIAKGCAVNGANVVLIDIDVASLRSVEAEIKELGPGNGDKPNTTIVAADLSSQPEIEKVIEKIKRSYESLDGLVHCAAVRFMNQITYKPGEGLEKLERATRSAPYQQWELAHRVNVLGPYFLTAGLVGLLGKAAAKGQGRGSVIMFSSPASVHNHQFVPVYQTTKAAVDHLVRIMAAEFADFYVRVNAISPGIVPSSMTDDGPTSNLHLAAQAPAGRAGTDEDMCGTAIWLMSKAGSFMDGKIIRCEGGRLLILKGVTSNSD